MKDAPPRPHPIVPAEWGRAELLAALESVAAPWRGAKLEARLRRALEARLGGATALPLNAGRTALALALETFAARRPGRRRVLIPDYVCPSVVEAVVAARCEPATVPVGDDLNVALSALESAAHEPGVLAIVAVHMYGAPAAIERIEALGRSAGVFVIDDAAQVLEIRVGERPLGTFGDVGILSFAQSKTVVTGVRGSGGALIVRDPELAAALERRVATLPRARRRSSRTLHFALSMRNGKIARSLAWRTASRSPADYRPARIATVDAAIALAQLESVNDRVSGRTRVAETYARELSRMGGVRMPQAGEGRYLTRVMVELPVGSDRESVRRALAEQRIGSRLPYDLAPAAAHGAVFDGVDRLLELPSHSRMADEHVAEVCGALRAALSVQG